VTVIELNLPFLVTGIERVLEQGDASLPQKPAGSKKSGHRILVVEIALTKNQKWHVKRSEDAVGGLGFAGAHRKSPTTVDVSDEYVLMIAADGTNGSFGHRQRYVCPCSFGNRFGFEAPAPEQMGVFVR